MEKKEKYFIFEELRNANPMVLHRFVDLNLINPFLKQLGVVSDLTSAVIKYEKEKVFIYLKSHEFDSVAGPIVDLFITKPDEGLFWNEKIIEAAERLIEENQQNKESILNSQGELADLKCLWERMEMQYAELFKFTWIHNSLDFKDNLFTTKLYLLLEAHIKEKGLDFNVNKTFVTLTSPNDKGTYFARLEKELELLSSEIKHSGIRTYAEICRNQKLKSLVEEIREKYCWLGFGFDGPAWDSEHFFDRATSASNVNNNATTYSLNELEEELELSEYQIKLFSLARNIVIGTELRKEAMFNYYYTLDLLFDCLAESLSVTKRLFRYVYPNEINNLENIVSELPERVKYHIDSQDLRKKEVLVGDEGRDFYSSQAIHTESEKIENVIIGQTAYPGLKNGTVKIINEKSDISKMEEGDILVSIATNPELLVAMKKASAFVTDRGGITCHAAIVSRELKIPCVVGTKIATKILKDGDRVEVNANDGTVTILK